MLGLEGWDAVTLRLFSFRFPLHHESGASGYIVHHLSVLVHQCEKITVLLVSELVGWATLLIGWWGSLVVVVIWEFWAGPLGTERLCYARFVCIEFFFIPPPFFGLLVRSAWLIFSFTSFSVPIRFQDSSLILVFFFTFSRYHWLHFLAVLARYWDTLFPSHQSLLYPLQFFSLNLFYATLSLVLFYLIVLYLITSSVTCSCNVHLQTPDPFINVSYNGLIRGGTFTDCVIYTRESEQTEG